MFLSDSEILQVSAHFLPDGGELGFEIVDFLLDGGEIDGGLLLEGIDVAGDVQVVVVFPDLLEGGAVGVFFDGLVFRVGADGAGDVLGAEFVLVGALGEVLLGVDEEGVLVGLALFEKQNGGGDAGAEEEIGGQADDAIQQVFLMTGGGWSPPPRRGKGRRGERRPPRGWSRAWRSRSCGG